MASGKLGQRTLHQVRSPDGLSEASVVAEGFEGDSATGSGRCDSWSGTFELRPRVELRPPLPSSLRSF